MHLRATSLTPADEALNTLVMWLLQQGFYSLLSPSVTQVISSLPDRFSHDRLGKVLVDKHTGFPHCKSVGSLRLFDFHFAEAEIRAHMLSSTPSAFLKRKQLWSYKNELRGD